MIKIAVCDDEKTHQDLTVDLLREYFSLMPSVQAQVTAFSEGEALLDHSAKHGPFDLYLLDILMPRTDGIGVGRQLRKNGDRGEIIFLTNSNDFASDSYDLAAFFYLLKPIQKEKLFSVLDRAMKKLGKRNQEVVLVQTSEGVRRIKMEDICYVERVGRCVRYCCTHEVVDSKTIRASFRQATAPLLSDRRFWLCGASFVLNFQRVRAVKGQIAQMENGQSVTLPRSAAVDFKKAWGNYWMEEQGGEQTGAED